MNLTDALKIVLGLARKMALTQDEKLALHVVEQYAKRCRWWQGTEERKAS